MDSLEARLRLQVFRRDVNVTSATSDSETGVLHYETKYSSNDRTH